MDKSQGGTLSAARDEANAAFRMAIAEMNAMPEGAERSRHLRGLATLLVGQSVEVRAVAISQCPELETAKPFPDTLLDSEAQQVVARLTATDLKSIDQALLSSSSSSWRTSPRVIGGAMVALDGQLPKLPLGLYVQRLGALVEVGKLLSKGNVEFMRLSEVRLAATDDGEA